jgi:polysaccharide biosynthesis protein PelE
MAANPARRSRDFSSEAASMTNFRAFIVSAIALVVAGIAQYLALASIFELPGAADPLLRFLAFQMVAGLAECIALRAWLPSRYREPRAVSMLLLWLFCTFVPLLGGVVVLVSCVWAALFPGEKESGELDGVPRPEFVTYLVSRVQHGGGARLQARLANTQVAPADRLSALVAIQNMPIRTTGTLLRELLADPLEDIRLIAYGTLDHAENEIMQKIFQTSQTLETTASEAERGTLNRMLAELYSELVYQNLVQGAVYRHTVEQADRYARIALESDPADAALWLTRGRLALASGDPDAAHAHIERALEFGFPRERLVPWLAEAAFLRGEYPLVSKLLASLHNAATLPTLNPVVKYWS